MKNAKPRLHKEGGEQGMRTEGKEVKAWALGIIQYALSTKNLVTTQITITSVPIHIVSRKQNILHPIDM
jgi:hypothetical protein